MRSKRPRSRESRLAIVLVLLAAGGAGLDAVSTPVRGAPEQSAAPSLFAAKAAFCPPRVQEKGSSSRIAVATEDGDEGDVGIEPAVEPVRVPAGRILVHRPAGESGSAVTGFGAPAVAGAVAMFTKPVEGAGAAQCSSAAASTWYFPQGSSELGYDERLLVYNPFPDEAVVKVTFVTPSGEKAKANLSDVAVPAGSSREIEVNQFIPARSNLGARVDAIRGRVVAWRALLSKPRGGIGGADLVLGARTPRTTWYFPEGGVSERIDERIAVLNPSNREAIVTITLSGARRVVQSPKLVDVKVPPLGLKSIAVRDRSGKELGGISAVLSSSNGVPVVAERRVVYSGPTGGVTSEMGAPLLARTWMLMPATDHPTTDGVVIMNPGSDKAVIGITLLRPSGALEPSGLRAINVPIGGRYKVPLAGFTKGAPAAVLVTSSSPVAAERLSYSSSFGDIAAVMGIPVMPTAR